MPLTHIRQEINALQLPSTGNCTSEGELEDMLCIPESLGTITHNIIGYIAGFIARRLLKALSCETCKTALIEDGSHNVFLIDIKNRGGLLRPSCDLCRLVADTEVRLRCAGQQVLKGHSRQALVIAAVRSAVNAGLFANLGCIEAAAESHQYFLLRQACENFVRVRVFHMIRQQNVKKQSLRHELTKKIIVMGQ